MDFEKAYQKFINGTATPEEVEFVRSEMKKANDINAILTNVKSEGATEAAEKETVKKAMKRYWKKDTKKIIIIACASILVFAIGLVAAIGIPVLVNANDNLNYTRAEAEEIAVQYLAEAYPENQDKFVIRDVERELEVGRIKNARYIYSIELYNGKGREIEIEIDAKSGKIIEVDWD